MVARVILDRHQIQFHQLQMQLMAARIALQFQRYQHQFLFSADFDSNLRDYRAKCSKFLQLHFRQRQIYLRH